MKLLLLGGGKIGRMITKFLSDTGEYAITVADVDASLLERVQHRPRVKTAIVDATQREALRQTLQGHDVVCSALSYDHNVQVAQLAQHYGLSYFDLTEDRETTRGVREVALAAKPGQVFVPQCGLAPGFVSIAAHQLTLGYDKVDKVHMRVGALPLYPSNALKYNLTWSTDGLINEYCNPCEAVHEGIRSEVLPLEGLEHFSLDGVRYEAFNTSGGLGTLCESLDGQVRELNYKTIRYQGHRDLMAFLVNSLQLGKRRELLKDILETSIPITFQDVVIVFCTVSGWRGGQLIQTSDARKIYHKVIDGERWSAIQITTAAGVCAMIDLFRQGRLPERGFVKQEQVSLEAFLQNRFGKHYESAANNPFAFVGDDQ